MDALLVIVLAGLVVSAFAILLSRRIWVLLASSANFISSSALIFWFLGAWQNAGAAWSGGQKSSPLALAFVGALLSLMFVLVTIRFKQRRREGEVS